MTRSGETLGGLDRLVGEAASLLEGRRFGLLAHAASVTRSGWPAHLALKEAGARPTVLFGPEHGYYGIEQDMVAAAGGEDPLTGAPLVSLYGDSACSLRPRPEVFDGLDLVVIDLQDIGTRYYTYAATAVWTAEAALAAGCEVWVLDRPNPLGGVTVEGNLPAPGLESFVSAFRLPIRHGLTLGELVRLERKRRGWPADAPLTVWRMEGWERRFGWSETGLPWVPPSPNMPTLDTALVYPGGCLLEATELSEGRGTTRPFLLVGAPEIEPRILAEELKAELAPRFPGVTPLPTYFRPQFQKHAGEVCGGVELLLTGREALRPAAIGVILLTTIARLFPGVFAWRRAPYEFVSDRPAIDLLAGSPVLREAIDGENRPAIEEWLDSWQADEAAFREERAEILLYPEVAAE